MYTISDNIKKQYVDSGQKSPEFFALFAYAKGMEYALEKLGKLGEIALKEEKDAEV